MKQLNYTLLIIRCRGCLEYKKRTCAGASSFAESCMSRVRSMAIGSGGC